MTATSANPSLVRHHRDDVKLFRSIEAKLAMGALAAIVMIAPFHLTAFQTSVGVFAGVAAIGALGLNLLTGFTGQVSLGHAAFLGIGAYTGAYVGGEMGLPFVVWIIAAGLAGALVGGAIGPFALRLRGSYLAIITLGLVFLAVHVFENWTSVTGGLNGRSVTAPVAIGPIDFANLSVLGRDLTRDHGYFLLVWGMVALAALAAKNIARSRPGRAMQAVRDRDLAAEAVGVNLARTKVMAFVLSSALAAVAGSLSASYNRFVSPSEFTLVLSIIYVAIIVVGGVGTTFGPILGAIFITAIPRVIETYSDILPFVKTDSGSGGIITVFSLNQAIFGLLIIVFLVFEPRGLAAIWLRLRAYFRSWPFSY
ncbi:MAG TPA: branched-chain amino acid ABC transporter permease [Acidimicrobiales bacterium]|nr:branched-chain amino acid ABC transporter permease [Acidimicrobiales bacterium]